MSMVRACLLVFLASTAGLGCSGNNTGGENDRHDSDGLYQLEYERLSQDERVAIELNTEKHVAHISLYPTGCEETPKFHFVDMDPDASERAASLFSDKLMGEYRTEAEKRDFTFEWSCPYTEEGLVVHYIRYGSAAYAFRSDFEYSAEVQRMLKELDQILEEGLDEL